MEEASILREVDGIWITADGAPYADQELANDPRFRAEVDRLAAAMAADGKTRSDDDGPITLTSRAS